MAIARALKSSASLLVLTTLATPSIAAAQAIDPTPEAVSQVEEVIVTGSRISRRDYQAESPVVTVGQEVIESAGSAPVETVLAQMPQFVPGNTSTSGQLRGSAQGTVDLRGLGAPRTLVLLDGRRMQPSAGNNVVDITTIPRALIAGVEVITGGASSTYGSDAVAGVVNFKLNRRFEGLQLDAHYGISDQGDDENWRFDITTGGGFADGRGRAVFSAGYAQRAEIYSVDREFYRRVQTASATIPQGLIPASANNPSQAAVNAVFAQYGVAPGTVSNASTFSFNDDGTLFATGRGVVNYRGPGAELGFTNNGTSVGFNGVDTLLQTPQTRGSVFAAVDYDVNDWVTAQFQFNYTHYDTTTQLAAAVADATNGLTIPVTNPFIPTDLRTLLASRPNPDARFPYEKRTLYAGARRTDLTYGVGQLLVGLTGRLPYRDWSWSAHASYGRTDETRVLIGWTSLSGTQQLLNAPDGGASLCAGGYDPFGLKTPSAECMNFLRRTPKDTSEYTQTDAEVNLQGDLFTLPAGEVRFAAGFGYRRNTYLFQPDELHVSGDVISPNQALPTDGETEVAELYGELLIPLLANAPLADMVELNLGYRVSDYAGLDTVSTYKATVNWRVNSLLTFRGGAARAIRAPSAGELFAPAAKTASTIGSAASGNGDPCDIRGRYRTGANAAAVRALCLAQGVPAGLIDGYVYNINTVTATTTGGLGLTPETADTFAIGAVFQSPFGHPILSSLSGSVDYYNIKVEDAIGPLTIGTSLQECFDNNPSFDNANLYCQQVVRDTATGVIVQTSRQPMLNLAAFQTEGVDIQLDWRADFADLGLSGLPGGLALNFVATHLLSYETQSFIGEPFRDSAGFQGRPSWKTSTTARYDVGAFQVMARHRFIDGMEATARIVNPANTTPPADAAHYLDLEGRWDVSEATQLRVGVTNALNAEPITVNGIPGSTDATLYDSIGRRYFIALRQRF